MIQRKAITEYYFLNDKNKKNTASFLATRSVDILPVSHVCNFDQSPQSVEPIAATTIGVRGAGEAPINTGGREKDRVTSQFASSVDGN